VTFRCRSRFLGGCLMKYMLVGVEEGSTSRTVQIFPHCVISPHLDQSIGLCKPISYSKQSNSRFFNGIASARPLPSRAGLRVKEPGLVLSGCCRGKAPTNRGWGPSRAPHNEPGRAPVLLSTAWKSAHLHTATPSSQQLLSTRPGVVERMTT
jgi:hypothetical protein